jgi:uncharacterized protein (UPF0147 family)
MTNYTERARIPSNDLLYSGLFVLHFFDINSNLDPVTDTMDARFFSSKFENPITEEKEQLLVLGLTGQDDGQNHRSKTNFLLVIDRSGSMRYKVTDIAVPRAHRAATQAFKNHQTKMELAVEAANSIFDILDDDEELGIVSFDEIAEVVEEV